MEQVSLNFFGSSILIIISNTFEFLNLNHLFYFNHIFYLINHQEYYNFHYIYLNYTSVNSNEFFWIQINKCWSSYTRLIVSRYIFYANDPRKLNNPIITCLFNLNITLDYVFSLNIYEYQKYLHHQFYHNQMKKIIHVFV